jgi:two-component system, chemotaxis family, CheB/CheR fusion protein
MQHSRPQKEPDDPPVTDEPESSHGAGNDESPHAAGNPESSRGADVGESSRGADVGESAHGAGNGESPPRPVVVGIGASAGGLSALRSFFAGVAEDSGLAYVVVMHLSPEHESHLAEVLQQHVRMPVQQVQETVPLEPNRVYVIPPGANLSAVDTHLRLTDLEQRRRERAPVDHFLRTLAATHDGHSVAVILSGTGSDGALGVSAVKDAAGLTVAQDPDEAEYDGMPRSALLTGMVDLVLPLESMPRAILNYARTRPRIAVPEDDETDDAAQRRLLEKVFAQIRARTDRDFSRYKRSTVLRRIQRRMQIRHVERLEDYLDQLRESAEEVRALADDLLITVTSFFRDPDIWQQLEERVIPTLFENRGPSDHVRVWSVGCATGEEAYSLSMLLIEQATRLEAPPQVQVFASDLHEQSLQRARDGFYPGDIARDVGEARLDRFFQREAGGYRIRKEVREPVVFAPHNLMADPPFSRMDLILCRNVLIYLQRDVQRDVIELFHYSLCPDGVLVLGTSETVEGTELFRAEDEVRCIYRKRNVRGPDPHLPVFPAMRASRGREVHRQRRMPDTHSYGQLHQRIVEQYGPPSILVSPDDRVVHLSENAGRYLNHPGGELTTSVFKLVRDELRLELRSALHTARERNRPVRLKPVAVDLDGERRQVALDVRPASGEDEQEGFVVVMFHKLDDDASPEPAAGHVFTPPDRELSAELTLARQQLQGIVEQYEAGQEDMRASHEELQSSNEELRSTLEELETSKEELQSMNEELQTVNQENRHKVEELAQLSGDLQNLLTATGIATLFLDRNLRIMRFTPKVGELFSIRKVDRGRPLSDLTHRLEYNTIQQDAEAVLRHREGAEREVRDDRGNWHLVRVLPYLGPHDRVDGVVINFIDITALKRGEEALRQSEERYRALIDASAQMVWTTDADGRVVEDSPSWRAFTGQNTEQWLGSGWLDAVHPNDRERAAGVWAQSVADGASVDTQWRIRRDDGSWRLTHVRAVPLRNADSTVRGWVGMNTDITERAEAERATRVARDAAEKASAAKSQFLGVISHELRTPLTAVIGLSDLMRSGVVGELNPKQTDYIERIRLSSWHLVAIIDEILTYTRSEAGKQDVRLAHVDVAEIVREVTGMLSADTRGLELVVEGAAEPVVVTSDGGKLRQIVTNLVGNALKYTDSGSVRVVVEHDDEQLSVRVEDTGPGIPEEWQEEVFQAFVQVDSSSTRDRGGTGLGLAVARRLAQLLGGDVHLVSEPGDGCTFELRLPVSPEDPPIAN